MAKKKISEPERQITKENVKKVLPVFGDVFIAVFNCRKYGVVLGRRAVIAKYGIGAWAKVKAKIRKGIMTIFGHKPTPADILFIETVAIHADRASQRRSAREQAKEGSWP